MSNQQRKHHQQKRLKYIDVDIELFGRLHVVSPDLKNNNKQKFYKYKMTNVPLIFANNDIATNMCVTADPGVTSLNLTLYHTFVVIDNEIILAVILLPSAESFKKGFCQLQTYVCARSTG